MQSVSPDTPALWINAVAWCYLATNAARVVTYLPQIIAVWRCRDGARSVSLLTWGSWVIGHVTAVLYGTFVVPDLFFVAVSVINLVCCAIVTGLAAQRRGVWRAGAGEPDQFDCLSPQTAHGPGHGGRS